MFTIPVAACVVGFCSVVFGTVNWRAPHDARCFEFDKGWRFCIQEILSEDPRAVDELKNIIGSKTVICSVLFENGRVKKMSGNCYLDNHAMGTSVAETMHKRGF